MFMRIVAMSECKITKNMTNQRKLSSKNANITSFCCKFAKKFEAFRNDCYLELTETRDFVKILKHLINGTVWSLLALYLLFVIVSQLPACQKFIGRKVAEAVERQIGTEVSIRRIDLGLFNRFIMDDVKILDQQHKEMISVGRLTARVNLTALSEGKIHISSAQLFGARINLYQRNAQTQPNYQFIIDSLAPKDTTSHTPLDLRVNSFIMRHCSIRYDQLDAEETPDIFNPHHLYASDISGHIILKALTDDAIDLNIKRFGFQEQSGLTINRLSLKLKADKRQAALSNLLLEMPSSQLKIDSISATYQYDENGLIKPSIVYQGTIDNTHITASDLRCFFNPLKNFQRDINLSTTINGTWQHLNVPHLIVYSEAGDIRLNANGYIDGLQTSTPQWKLNTTQLILSDNIIDFLQKNIGLPPIVKNVGNLEMNGNFSSEHDGTLTAKAFLRTSIGQVDTDFTLSRDRQFQGRLKTTDFDLQRLAGNDQLGTLTADLQLDGTLQQGRKPIVNLQGTIGLIDYNSYPFRNITVNGSYSEDLIAGLLQIDDPNINAELKGEVVQAKKDSKGKVNIDGTVRHLSPKALNLSERWGDAVFAGDISANLYILADMGLVADAFFMLQLGRKYFQEFRKSRPWVINHQRRLGKVLYALGKHHGRCLTGFSFLNMGFYREG